MKIEWHVRQQSQMDKVASGHGIHYHDEHRTSGQGMVAFIEGFEWLRQKHGTVRGYHIPPDDITTGRVLAAMKKRIESLVAAQELVGCGRISRRIHCVANA